MSALRYWLWLCGLLVGLGTGWTANLAGTARDLTGVLRVLWACPTCTPAAGTAACAGCGADATQVAWQVVEPIGLALGANVVTVTAENAAGQQGHATLTVLSLPDAGIPTVLTLVGCLESPTPARVSCTLAWTSAAGDVVAWQLDQCHNLPSGCRWEARLSFDGSTRAAIVPDLQQAQSQCWQVVPLGGTAGARVSNTVCR